MGNKQRKITQNSKHICLSNSPRIIALQPNKKDDLNFLPNEIIFCIFDYLLPADIIRAFQYDLERFSPLIKQYLVIHGFNLLKIKSNDSYLIPICLSIIEQQHLSICTKDGLLPTVLKSIPSPTTLTVMINTSFQNSFLSKLPHESISCNKLILEYTPSYYRQMNDIDIIPLLSSSVKTLILRNVIFSISESSIGYKKNSLQHIRCILQNEDALHELLVRFPMLISIDIRLLSHAVVQTPTALTVPKYFRIEYPYTTILNLEKFPPETKYYDQTVYSLPWLETNSSIVLRSCNPTNYANSFPYPLRFIRRLTIECTLEPWSFEFVTFLRQMFPNTCTLYAIQKVDQRPFIITIITATDSKRGRCVLDEPYYKLRNNSTMYDEPVRFTAIDQAYN